MCFCTGGFYLYTTGTDASLIVENYTNIGNPFLLLDHNQIATSKADIRNPLSLLALLLK